MSNREIMDAMGSQATDAEVGAMAEILAERGIEDLDDISDEDFFALIPAAIERAKPLRDRAKAQLAAELENAERYQHARNYHKLHIYRDGTLGWSEYLNRSDDTIDNRAAHFAPIPSVITVGTGSYDCNCDYCDMVYYPAEEQRAAEDGRPYDRASKYATREDAISDALADSDLSGYQDDMLAALEGIPQGYFDDEEKEL